MPDKNLQILMLEQDNDDRYITEEMMKALGFTQPLIFFSSSNELLQFLSTTAKPALILIDYNLNIESGLDVLKRIKENKDYRKYPVAILSESTLPEYVQECYAYGASTFIKKPVNMKQTQDTIQTFFRYWLEIAEV